MTFNSRKGLTLEHGNQSYRIATIEKEKIGGLRLYRYRTRQGEEFLYIPSKKVMIPPYVTPWYALPSTTDVYLDKKYKHELLNAAIDKATGYIALLRELEERGTYVRKGFLWEHLNDRVDGIKVNNLISILAYLDRNLNEPDSHITAIGCQRAVESPNLPFKLYGIDGTRLDAARFSDGSLSLTHGRKPRFDYVNSNAEQITRIAKSLIVVFGKPNIILRHLPRSRIPVLRTTSEVIGCTLRRSGAITGEVVSQNPDIPSFIREGTREVKREWLRQASVMREQVPQVLLVEWCGYSCRDR